MRTKQFFVNWYEIVHVLNESFATSMLVELILFGLDFLCNDYIF